MAVASTMQWEVRPATGSDSQCGGGFDAALSGTDYSQQATAQATGNVTSSGTTVTANSGITFTSGMVGNVITDGTHFFEIMTFVSSSQVTVDAAPSWTSVTVYVGGARASYANTEGRLVAGNKCWIKADGANQTISSSIACANSGDYTSGAIVVQGYHVTRGDHDGTRPLITTATNNLKMITDSASVTTNCRIFDNLALSSTAGTPGYGFVPGFNHSGSDWVLSNLKLSGLLAGVLSDNSIAFAIAQLAIWGTEITGCTDAIVAANTALIRGCYLHGNSGSGLKIPSNAGPSGGTPYRLANNIFYSNLNGINVLAAAGGSATTGVYLDVNSSIFHSNTGNAIANAIAAGNLSMLALQNSIFWNQGSGYGVTITNPQPFVLLNRNNAYGNNLHDRSNLAVGTGDITLTADPATNAAGGDFSRNSTAGGGALLAAAGWPGSIPGLVTGGFADVGALQAQVAAVAPIIISSPRKVR